MTNTLLSPPYNKFMIDDIPIKNEVTINEIVREKTVVEYCDKIKNIIIEYSNDAKNHALIPSLLAVPYYFLMKEGFLNKKSDIIYKIKFNGKSKEYKYVFGDSIKEKKSRNSEEDFAQIIGYDLKDLPLLAKLLAIGNHLTEDSVNQRLNWM